MSQKYKGKQRIAIFYKKFIEGFSTINFKCLNLDSTAQEEDENFYDGI